MSDFG